MSEGNIISFRVFIDEKGVLMTEYSLLPLAKIKNVFSTDDVASIEKIVKELDPLFKNMHQELSEELQALQ
jgi:hypothetical protein|tara:strand:+ start:29 stop:238 length:210 start_codon:yes stop_codon:yes gene_type:complete